MKDFIVLIASVLLGLALFSLIAGNGNDSIKSHLKNTWTKEITLRNYEEY